MDKDIIWGTGVHNIPRVHAKPVHIIWRLMGNNLFLSYQLFKSKGYS